MFVVIYYNVSYDLWGNHWKQMLSCIEKKKWENN